MSNRATLSRDEHGVVHIRAANEPDLYFGLGRCHARDRGLQMLFMRILGRGAASEHLDGSDEMLEVDKFFRRMNWTQPPADGESLTPRAKAACDAYVEGVNSAFNEKTPWELKLLGYRPDPWSLGDTYCMARMVSYLTLAQSQAEMERLFLQMVRADVPLEKLEALFGDAIAELDVDLVKKVRLGERFVPDSVNWVAGSARMVASNNWVVSKDKSATGSAILANDPHLEINRLPSVWQEVVLERTDQQTNGRNRYAITATMPGIPGMIITRTNDLSWGPTYTFMDAVDSWVEHVKDGQYRRGDGWHDFDKRTETIRRKGKAPTEVTFYENEHGVLDGDPNEEGYVLATRWSTERAGPRSLSAMISMWDASDVEEGMARIGEIESAFSWVLADTGGHIGFQMSGLMPKRREGASGFVPLPGWIEDNDWRGFEDPTDLPRCYDPESGYFATANQDLNAYGQVAPLNLDQGPYRAERIGHVLAEKDTITLQDVFDLQQETYALQAERFMEIARPLLPSSRQADLLKNWDLHYDADSRGAYLFERFYLRLLQSVFGAGFGAAIIDFLADETGMFADFFINFDRVLLAESSPWFDGKSREEVFSAALEAALKTQPRPWGEGRQLELSHILFGEKLPRWLGFNRGPITLKGGRSTVHQGQIYKSAGRTTSFAPSIRFVTDMGTHEAHTRLCGGPTDRRFSRWYCSELEAWLEGTYKVLRP